MPLTIVRNDITKMKVNAIVNSANMRLQPGGGVCGVIFKAAGMQELQGECDAIDHCERGEAVITKGYNLPAHYIIHTVGPVWNGGKSGEALCLQACYTNSMQLAVSKGCKSVAFPLISSGIYGYPKEEALQVALSAIKEFLLTHELNVYLVVFERESFSISKELFNDIKRYIDDNYTDDNTAKRLSLHSEESSRERFSQRNRLFELDKLCCLSISESYIDKEELSFIKGEKYERTLDDLGDNLAESFSDMLLRLIDEKGMTAPEVYRKANIDRKLFSKIHNHHSYQPKKPTVIAFAIALQLSMDETLDLLKKAGYTLSESILFDVIVCYFIMNGKYDIYEVNEALFDFDQPTLGV